MECIITKDIVKAGIVDTIKKVLAENKSLYVKDNTVTLKREPSLITKEQQKLIDSSKLLSDQIVEPYRNSFQGNEEAFLREMARGYNGNTEDQRKAALDISGPILMGIALKTFPSEGLASPYQNIIDQINKDFKEEVIRHVDDNKWVIEPSDGLAMKYIMSQPNAKDQIEQHLHEYYLSFFSKDSLNLQTEDLWYNHPSLQDPTSQDLIKFLQKINPNANIQILDDMDKNAILSIRDYTIHIRNGSIIDELPHEAAHFFVEMLPDDHPLKKEIMEKVVDYPIYSKVYQQYKNDPFYQKNGVPDINKIKREAAAQLIGDYVKDAYHDTADEKYGTKRNSLKDLVHRFMKWLRRIFVTNAAPVYTEPAFDVGSPFAEAAEAILDQDISMLNIQKIPTIYDSVFFSKVEDKLPEGYEAGHIAKSLHEFAKALKKQLQRVYFKYAKTERYEGLMNWLKDEDDYNRIWHSIRKLEDSMKLLSDQMTSDDQSLISLGQGADMLGQAFHEMQVVPDAIKSVIREMATTGTEGELFDNLTELQSYLSFSSSFENMTSNFKGLFAHLEDKYKIVAANDIFQKMDSMVSDISGKFEIVDRQIMTRLKDHLIKITSDKFNTLFEQNRAEMTAAIGVARTEQKKRGFNKHITDKVAMIEHIKWIFSGNFPTTKQLTEQYGKKQNIKKIRDISDIDNVIFFFSSPSLLADPVIQTVVNIWSSHYMEGLQKGYRDAKVFADKVTPIKVELSKQGMGWYEAEEAIQSVQSSYDRTVEDKNFKVRALLSPVKRSQANFESQIKQDELSDMREGINSIRGELIDEKTTDARRTEITDTLLPQKLAELTEKVKAYNEYQANWWNRPYSPEYYNVMKEIQESRNNDSPQVKRLKEINKLLVEYEQIRDGYVATDNYVNSKPFEEIAFKIAALQEEKGRIQEKLPDVDAGVWAKYDEVHEIDQKGTDYLAKAHRYKTVSSIVKVLTEHNGMSKEEAEATADHRYDMLYKLRAPTKQFYDERKKIFDEIATMTTSLKLEKLNKKLTDLREQEAKILKALRGNIRGEITLSSMKYITIEKDANGRDMLLSESLAQSQIQMNDLKNRIRVYSSIIEDPRITPDEQRVIMAYVDLSMAFANSIESWRTFGAEDVKKEFEGLISLTTSQAESILSAIKDAAKSNNTSFQTLTNLNLGNADPAIKAAFSLIKFGSPEEMVEYEDSIYNHFRKLSRKNTDKSDLVTAKFEELANMYSTGMSIEYAQAMKEFFVYYEMYLRDNSYTTGQKDIHMDKYIQTQENAPSTVQEVEDLMSDGVFEAVMDYMFHLEGTENSDRAYPLSDLIRFIDSLHRKKVTYPNRTLTVTYTPQNYARKIKANDEWSQPKTPNFLVRRKVADKYLTPKIYETDNEAITGAAQPTVDMFGRWLPLDKADSPYHDEKYAKLAADHSPKGKALMGLLSTMKADYLQKQLQLEPDRRLDHVFPAKGLDHLEELKATANIFVGKVQFARDYINNMLSRADKDKMEGTEQNLLEDIQAVTVENRELYTGRIISENAVKLQSLRKIPLDRQTKDATSAIAMFMEDVNNYEAKIFVEPIMKSFKDVLNDAYQKTPAANKNRARVMDTLYKTKVLEEVPDLGNNKTLAKWLRGLTTLTTQRLLGDPVGAAVAYMSGTLQHLIEFSVSAKEFATFGKTMYMAKNYALAWGNDYYKGSNHSLNTQLVGVFNMTPDNLSISHHLSIGALLSNIRSKLMIPRSYAERYMAVHIGLSIIMSEPIIHDAKEVTINDIYDLDPTTALVRLKPEYISLNKEWNPVNGTEVVRLRNKITQLYTLIQGNFYKHLQSYGSSTAIGRQMELMKRYFPSGFAREWQGRVPDLMTGDIRKGRLLSVANALREVFGGLMKGDIQGIKGYFAGIGKSPSEMKALRRGMAEIIYLMAVGSIILWGLGYDDDDKDKNKKMREMAYSRQLALLVMMRVQGELGTFVPVPMWGLGYMEMKRAIVDPLSLGKTTITNLMGIGAMITYHILDAVGLGDYETKLKYQKHKPYAYNFGGVGAFKDKGDSKLLATILNTIGYTGYTFEPQIYIQSLDVMQNSLRN